MSDMLPRPEPRDAFKRALRAQLMAEARTVLARRETVWSRFQRAWLRPAAALATVALLLAAGTTKAAADSLPGDAAYPLKRTAEQVQLAFALDETTRLRLLAGQADHRLAELAESITAHRPATGIAQHEYAGAISTLAREVDTVRGQQGVSEDKKNEVEDIVDGVRATHETVLQQLEQQGDVNDEDKHDIEEAKQESQKLRPSERPGRTPEPSGRPERTRSPQLSKAPTRTSERPGGTRSPEPARTGQSTRSPEPNGDDGDHGDRPSLTPAPPVRR